MLAWDPVPNLLHPCGMTPLRDASEIMGMKELCQLHRQMALVSNLPGNLPEAGL